MLGRGWLLAQCRDDPILGRGYAAVTVAGVYPRMSTASLHALTAEGGRLVWQRCGDGYRTAPRQGRWWILRPMPAEGLPALTGG